MIMTIAMNINIIFGIYLYIINNILNVLSMIYLKIAIW